MTKKLTVLVDVNPLVIGGKSGVGYYTEGLIKALATTYPDLQIVGHYFNFLGRKQNLSLPQAPNICYAESRFLPGKVLSITRHMGFQPPIELFFRGHFDYALFPSFVSLPSMRKKPSAIVLHDLCYLEMPEFVHAKNRLFLKHFVPKSLKQSRLVICVSNFTKQAAQNHYDTSKNTLLVTHIPPMEPINVNQIDLSDLGITGDYLLYLGTLEPRKNIHGLVEAYCNLPDSLRSNYALVLAGKVGWYMDEDLKYIRDQQQKGFQIVMPGYITEEQRGALYKQATACILASFYEGFGMPILEAMTYGTPTLISDIPVFHEVADEASLYFDPNESHSITEAMSKILNDATLRKQLSQLGSSRLKVYDWTTVAQQVYEAIQKELV